MDDRSINKLFLYDNYQILILCCAILRVVIFCGGTLGIIIYSCIQKLSSVGEIIVVLPCMLFIGIPFVAAPVWIISCCPQLLFSWLHYKYITRPIQSADHVLGRPLGFAVDDKDRWSDIKIRGGGLALDRKWQSMIHALMDKSESLAQASGCYRTILSDGIIKIVISKSGRYIKVLIGTKVILKVSPQNMGPLRLISASYVSLDRLSWALEVIEESLAMANERKLLEDQDEKRIKTEQQAILVEKQKNKEERAIMITDEKNIELQCEIEAAKEILNNVHEKT